MNNRIPAPTNTSRLVTALARRAGSSRAGIALLALVWLALSPPAGAAQPASWRLSTQPADFTCADVTQIPLAECQALVALYQSSAGAGWSSRGGWLASDTPCAWFGVSCAAGRVTALDLSDNQLSGNLPANLGDLASLERLSLANNQLSGPLPASLVALAELQVLDLADNDLQGSLPAELGSLTRLQTLQVWGNELSGELPISLGALVNLRTLALSGNQLTGSIPAGLGNLASLQELNLANNRLSGAIPASLGGLTNLRRLALSGNQLSGPIPAALGHLASLQQLWLDRNQLSGEIPAQLGGLASLRGLGLSVNRLSGAVPAELAGLARLQELWLASNQLEGSLSDAWCNLTDLIFLDMGFNMLTAAPACLDLADPFWHESQTVAPAGLQAEVHAQGDVLLTWTPIAFRTGVGAYEVSFRPAGGDYAVHGQTIDKAVSSYTVSGLAPGVTYEFCLRTFSAARNEPPANQQSDLWSSYTQAVSATTPGGSPARYLRLPLVEISRQAQ